LKRLEEEALVSRVQFDAAVERLKQNSAGGLLVTPDSEILSGATASREPLYPGRAGRMVNIVLAGFGLALLLVLVRQMRNPGLLSPEHVHFLLGESTIGVIPAVPDHVKPHELVLDDPDSSFAEAVGALKITLDLADLDHPAKVIQLASSLPGEGRAVLAVALARAEAKAGRKVLLVSAHLRSSTIEKKLGVNDRVPGLTDLLLSEESTLVDVVIGDDRSGVDFLSAGTAEYANADVVFSSQRMQSLVEEMRSTYDFVIFDTPPLVSTADAIAVGRLVDKTLFVARWNKTPKRVVAASLRKLRSGGLDIAGVVLQHVNLRRYGSIGFSDFGYLYHQKK
jgi:capsular exopolysaccharide synthesis family protein